MMIHPRRCRLIALAAVLFASTPPARAQSLSDALTFLVAPQVQWDYETGASASDGLSYGAVLGAVYKYSPTLTVGSMDPLGTL